MLLRLISLPCSLTCPSATHPLQSLHFTSEGNNESLDESLSLVAGDAAVLNALRSLPREMQAIYVHCDTAVLASAADAAAFAALDEGIDTSAPQRAKSPVAFRITAHQPFTDK